GGADQRSRPGEAAARVEPRLAMMHEVAHLGGPPFTEPRGEEFLSLESRDARDARAHEPSPGACLENAVASRRGTCHSTSLPSVRVADKRRRLCAGRQIRVGWTNAGVARAAASARLPGPLSKTASVRISLGLARANSSRARFCTPPVGNLAERHGRCC